MARQANALLLLLLCREVSSQALVCKGTPPGTDSWCNNNCNHNPPYCPEDLCTCSGGAATTAAATTSTRATTTTPVKSTARSTSTLRTTVASTPKVTTTPVRSTAQSTSALRTTVASASTPPKVTSTLAKTSTITLRAVTTAAKTTAAATTVPAGTTAATGTIKGFWYGYAGSASTKPAPSSGWYFNFPGLLVDPPFTAGSGYIPSDPSWGSYQKRLLTQGGGGTSWGNRLYVTLQGQLSSYGAAGWDGVCWDWETVAADHTTAGFNALMRATKAAGLLNIVTTTAEGPYEWSAPSKDAAGLDWTAVDYLVPQMYGADCTLPAEWETYAQYWVSGAGKASIHGVTFATIPMSKILWGMPVGSCGLASKFGGGGCVEWDYTPNVRP